MSTPRRPRGDTLDSTASSTSRDDHHSHHHASTSSYLGASSAAPQPTYASFSPATLSASSKQPVSAAKRLSTILVHQKSPLLLATPPQVTRALAYSHPFLLPLNKLAGLLTWTTGDAWESFLLLGVFWAIVLYGDVTIRFAGPVVLVLLLIGGMYGRRFSPLSSSGWSEDGGAGGGNTGKVGKGKTSKGKGSAANNDGTGSGAGTSNPSKNSASSSGAKGADTKKPAGGGGGHGRAGSEATNTKHQKTLDEIVETLKEFTARCNILLEPLLELTDFLSTQRTATSATTKPALMTLFVRILLCTPFWVALTFPPFRVITTRRVILCFGTIVLTWHARVVKAGRTILWRSASIRRLAALMTGLKISIPAKPTVAATKVSDAAAVLEKGAKAGKGEGSSRESELTKAIRRARGAHDAGVRFTFIIYENQRRWVGLGWTNSLFAYERAAWTDEHNNAVPSKDKFELPGVEEDTQMRWRWVESSRWRVDGVPDEAVNVSGKDGKWDFDGEGGKNGWVYYDNKWQNGRRGQDGWGRWTRRRKWYRDAELVEIDSDEEPEDEDETNITPAADEGNKEGRGTRPRINPTTTSSAARHQPVASSSSTEDTPTPTAEQPPRHQHKRERTPSLPPRPRSPTLALPCISTNTSTDDLPLSSSRSNTINDSFLKEIKEEDPSPLTTTTSASDKDKEETSSVVSTSASSRASSMRFRVPSLRRRITDNTFNPSTSNPASSPNPNPNITPSSSPILSSAQGFSSSPLRNPNIRGKSPISPRAVSISAYSTSSANSPYLRGRTNTTETTNGRSRRTSEVQSEDDAASLGPQVGLVISRDRGQDSSWGVGDEVVMGLE